MEQEQCAVNGENQLVSKHGTSMFYVSFSGPDLVQISGIPPTIQKDNNARSKFSVQFEPKSLYFQYLSMTFGKNIHISRLQFGMCSSYPMQENKLVTIVLTISFLGLTVFVEHVVSATTYLSQTSIANHQSASRPQNHNKRSTYTRFLLTNTAARACFWPLL